MLNATSAAVSYEAAWTLVSLSSAPTAVRAAAATYTGLLNSQSDNNVKLIVLERIAELQKHHSKVLGLGWVGVSMAPRASQVPSVSRRTIS